MQNGYVGLCWGENAHVHGKDNFPYAEAAIRSIQLWHKLTDAKVIMQLVHATEKPSKVLSKHFCTTTIDQTLGTTRV